MLLRVSETGDACLTGDCPMSNLNPSNWNQSTTHDGATTACPGREPSAIFGSPLEGRP